MKPFALLALALGLALAAGAQTELYSRYAQHDNVRVASVSNFTIDSAAHVDVTIVEAENDAGWAWMRSEFAIGALAPEQQGNIDSGLDVVLFTRRSRSNPGVEPPVVGEHVSIQSSCYMGISYLSRTVYFFCADTEEQSDAIVGLLLKKIIHQTH